MKRGTILPIRTVPMCSVVTMPADYDLLLAHSPPVFSHSPPLFYSSYNSCRLSNNPPLTIRSPRQSPTPVRRANTLPTPKQLAAVPPPRRPILVLRHDDSCSSDENDAPSPTRTKKRVVFADDKGLSLTQIRTMSEPSFMPPSWNSQFLKLVTQGVTAEVTPEPWECTFPQPASDYLEFRRRLDENYVSLENVIVKESEESFVGTVKVKNVTFEKEVFIRSSSDDWVTQEDTYCTYVNNASPSIPGSVKVIYDTFSFKVTLPPRSRKVEFCVCYRSGDREHWDSNSGKNYVVVKKDPSSGVKVSEPMPIPRRRYSDAAVAKVGSWTEFASWNHLINDSPYW